MTISGAIAELQNLINADDVPVYYKGGIEKVIETILMELPTIEVVHCQDCKASKVYQNDSSGVEGRFCEAFTQVRMVADDDFCSYGERKEE